MNKDTGGPAFPTTQHDMGLHVGMTLRDYFAAKAMQGMCASLPKIVGSTEEIPKLAYQLADAMIKARHGG